MRSFSSGLLAIAGASVIAGCSSTALANGLTPVIRPAQSLAQSAKSGHGVQPKTGTLVVIQTIKGNYVTAVGGGGGSKQANCGKYTIALHENATSIGPRETFRLVPVRTNKYGIETSGNYYVTAVNGGGIGGPNYNRRFSQLHTNATHVGPWEMFAIVTIDSAHVAIQTPDGKHYVTAVNGGGCGGPNTVPFHTNARTIGPWEQFTVRQLLAE